MVWSFCFPVVIWVGLISSSVPCTHHTHKTRKHLANNCNCSGMFAWNSNYGESVPFPLMRTLSTPQIFKCTCTWSAITLSSFNTSYWKYMIRETIPFRLTAFNYYHHHQTKTNVKGSNWYKAKILPARNKCTPPPVLLFLHSTKLLDIPAGIVITLLHYKCWALGTAFFM